MSASSDDEAVLTTSVVAFFIPRAKILAAVVAAVHGDAMVGIRDKWRMLKVLHVVAAVDTLHLIRGWVVSAFAVVYSQRGLNGDNTHTSNVLSRIVSRTWIIIPIRVIITHATQEAELRKRWSQSSVPSTV